MERIKNALQLMKASWDVLRRDRELLLLPALSFLASAALLAAVFFGFLWDDVRRAIDAGTDLAAPGAATWVLFAVVAYALSYIAIFFNVAMVCAADERMRGGDPTVAGALRDALAHARAIAPWALVSVVVSSVIRAVEERGGIVGQIVGTIAGVAWALITYLVLPVIVLEGVGVRDAIRRSRELFVRTWGETVSGEIGLSLVAFLAGLAALPFVLFLGGGGEPAMVVAALVLLVVWFVVVGLALSALNMIFRVALYRFATDGEAPEGFEHIDMAAVFPPKRRRRLI